MKQMIANYRLLTVIMGQRRWLALQNVVRLTLNWPIKA